MHGKQDQESIHGFNKSDGRLVITIMAKLWRSRMRMTIDSFSSTIQVCLSFTGKDAGVRM